VLLKSRNSFEDILEGDFVYLDGTGAQHLKDRGVIGVGSDALGIERAQPAHETHKALLGCGIVILEGLRLADVPEGEYLLVAAPVKIRAEAAPVRAILLEGMAL
jgi:arylformamidase